MTIQEDIKIKRKELLQLRAEAHSQHIPLNDDHSIGHDINCQLCKLYNQIVTDDELLKEELELLRVDDLIIDEFNSMRNHLGEIPKIGHFVNNHANEIGERFGSWDIFFQKADKKFNQRK